MQRPWWAPIVQWTLWALLMTLIMGWVAKSRLRPRPESDACRLAHPPSTLIIGVISFTLFAGIAILSNVYRNKSTTIFTTAGFLGFAALSLVLIADYFLARHEVSDAGMDYGRLAGRRRSLQWSEVVRVRYVPSMNWFKLQTRSGEIARVSNMLMGLPEFARATLAHVAPSAIDPDTRSVLEATAAGDPPRAWG